MRFFVCASPSLKIYLHKQSIILSPLPMQRTLYFLAVLLVTLTVIISCQPGKSNVDHVIKKPNVIVLLADDLGYGDLTCYNKHAKLSTPNIDQLADNGLLFTDAHANASVCTPTRYGLLTGRYCFRTRLKKSVLTGYSDPLISESRSTLASMYKKIGYQTACIGKWHLGLGWTKADTTEELITGGEWNPTDINIDFKKELWNTPNNYGFDYSYIIGGSLDMPPYCYVENRKVVGEIDTELYQQEEERGIFWRKGPGNSSFEMSKALPTFVAKSLDYIAKRDKEKPFFMYLPLPTPHTPWVPNEKFENTSGAGNYGDFIQQFDSHVGELVATLKNEGILDNTILVITSDNGAAWKSSDLEQWGHNANYYWKGQKADIWEGGHRIPFVVHWPETIKEPKVTHQLLSLTDLYATLAQISGISVGDDEAEDSYDLSSVLYGIKGDTTLRDHIIHHSGSGMFGIRYNNWKYIDDLGSGGFTSPQEVEIDSTRKTIIQAQLFDFKVDSLEHFNVVNEFPNEVKILKEKLLELAIDNPSSKH